MQYILLTISQYIKIRKSTVKSLFYYFWSWNSFEFWLYVVLFGCSFVHCQHFRPVNVIERDMKVVEVEFVEKASSVKGKVLRRDEIVIETNEMFVVNMINLVIYLVLFYCFIGILKSWQKILEENFSFMFDRLIEGWFLLFFKFYIEIEFVFHD